MPPRVLIVEDSALVVGALRLLLEEGGFKVSSAPGVREAVDLCRSEKPDAMLLDLSLRDGSGFEVLDTLRPSGELPPVTVALTGDDNPHVRERCLAAGCRDVLVKPVSPRALEGRLRELLGSRL